MPYSGADNVGFDIIAVCGGNGIDQSLIGLVDVGVSVFSDPTVVGFHQ